MSQLPDGYRVELDAYAGPMDLLLYLVRRHEIDLNDIPIAKLTDQYLRHLKVIETIDVENAGEFLVMAATLLEIKSAMIMPPPEAGEGEDSAAEGDENETSGGGASGGDPRYELVQQLLAYKRYKDAAIGLVFPALFSIGVILISLVASDVHLDADAVLLGDPAFAWIERLEIGGRDLGPRALWLMGGVLALCALFVGVFYKELKLTTFDGALAAALGFAPVALHYALMALVSVVAVGAFDVVGSVLVVALMIAPPAAAWLLTNRLEWLIGLSVALGAASALGGYWVARWLDASIAGAMAGVSGLVFALAFALAPERGLLAQALRRRRQRATFAERMLLVHLLHHENTPEAERECRVSHLEDHLRWDHARALLAVRTAEREGAVTRAGDWLALTASGRERAQRAMVE